MALAIFFIGMLVFFISIIFLIVRLVTKKSKKPVTISILLGFIMMIVGFVLFEPEEDTTREEVSGITKQKDKYQNEVEKETINSAVKGNFVELNSGEFPKDKVFYINGKITDIIKDGSLGRFSLNISDVYGGGILLVDNFSDTSSLKNGDDVTIYGVYKGADEETSIPVMSATIIKVYEEDEVYDSTKDDIEEKVKDITRDFNSTSAKEIKVNENMATDDPHDYIVLVYLSFDAKNSKKTTRDMINMYNNELGAQLAKVSEVGELTVFWEVPYHLEDENSAKANLKRNGDNMFFEEEWYAPVLQ